MRTVDDYVDAARAALKITSDRELSRRLSLSPASVNQWRTKRSWPADTTMIRLAELAGVDPAEALLELNQWRSDSATVRDVYDRIAHRLAATAASIIVAFGVAGYRTAEAGAMQPEQPAVYYGKWFASLLRLLRYRLKSAINPPFATS